MKKEKLLAAVVFAFAAFVMVSISSCKKDDPEPDNQTQNDPCDGVECLNGGECIDGTCDCPEGWTGEDCSEEIDPCDGVNCENGDCNDGECDCDDGWTGEECDEQETPSLIKITEVLVNSFPATDGGSNWDNFDGPDLYPDLFDTNDNLVWSGQQIFFEDADPNSGYTFSVQPNFNISIPFGTYAVRFYDYDDFDADDFMGGFYFSPYDSDNGFPEYVEYNSGDFNVIFHLEYYW